MKSKVFLRNARHWNKHGFETFSGFEKFEKRDNIAQYSARNRRAIKVIFLKICAHYGKNAPMRARRGILDCLCFRWLHFSVALPAMRPTPLIDLIWKSGDKTKGQLQ